MVKFVRFLLCAAIPFTAFAQLAPPDVNGLTFGHVHLNVHDIEVHKKLWVDHFGGTVVQKGSLTGIKLPGMLILLNKTDPKGGSQGTVMDHFGFKVRDMAAFLAKWRAAGLPVQSEFTGAEGFPNAYIMAPDEVRVELQEDKTMPVDVIGYHLHFQTPDYEKLLAWYIEKFNLKLRKRGTITTTTDVPGMNLSFANSRTPTGPTRGHSLDHIGFDVTDLTAFCKALEAKGVKLDTQPREVPSLGLKIAFLTDPDGTYIELTEGLSKW